MRTTRQLMILLALAAAGCSGRGLVFTETVEGTLTLDGAPVPDALVQFVPDLPDGTTAPSSGGTTDAKGFFRLTRSDNQKAGALVGRHKVVVFPGRAAADRDNSAGATPSPVPAVYMNASKTPLTVEVTRDKQTYNVTMSRAGGG
ncbi:MAG TPA: hypothetical protein VFW33_07280 [Gemmataceae bacterium]|nr:hypothetical protein [Gemmataceae bacterium]